MSNIDTEDVTKFPLMKVVGDAMGEFICKTHQALSKTGNWFQSDFLDSTIKRGTLVISHGYKFIDEIISNLSNKN